MSQLESFIDSGAVASKLDYRLTRIIFRDTTAPTTSLNLPAQFPIVFLCVSVVNCLALSIDAVESLAGTSKIFSKQEGGLVFLGRALFITLLFENRAEQVMCFERWRLFDSR